MNNTQAATFVRSASLTALGVAALLSFAGCSVEHAESQPTSPPTDTEWQERIDAQWADVLVAHPDAQRPDVTLVEYVSLENSFSIFAKCMNAEGFSEVVVKNGKLSLPTPPPTQTESFDIAIYVCDARYPVVKEPSGTKP